MDPKGVLEFANKHNAKILDLRFTDLPGLWQHVSYPIGELEESSFKDGFGFDGSSIRGWQSIHESDMLLLPDPNTAFMDPFRDTPTLVLICNIGDPITHKPYPRDPRQIAIRAEAHLKETGVADQAFFGAEAEFFIFDSVRFDTAPQHGFYLHRFRRRPLEQRPRRAQPGLSPALQGRLLPRPAHRPFPGFAHGDGDAA